MMDIEKLIEQYRQAADKWEKRHPITGTFDLRVQDALRDAATALSTLQAENEKLRAELEQVKRERDAAVDEVERTVERYVPLGPYDRLRKLAQADREGRCIVLPCKKGDTVWRIVHDAAPHITKDRCTDIKYENRDIWVHLIGDRVMGGWNFGKLLFLTREDAEAALRREQE